MKTISISTAATCITLLSLSGVMHSADAFVSPQSYAPLSYQRTQTTTQHYLPSPPSSQSSDAAAATRQSSTLLYLGAEVNELWNSYLDALEANPLLVKSITAGVILGAADLSGQAIQQVTAATTKEIAATVMEEDGGDNTTMMTSTGGGGGVDIARFVRFAFFGFILQAPWNHFYYQLLDGALPPTVDPFTSTTFIKVLIDQFIQAPIFTVLIFGFLGVLEGKSLDAIKGQLDDDYVDTMVANWKLWVPATVVNIAFCPPILRVLFLNVVFFFWSIFLSLKLNKTEE